MMSVASVPLLLASDCGGSGLVQETLVSVRLAGACKTATLNALQNVPPSEQHV